MRASWPAQLAADLRTVRARRGTTRTQALARLADTAHTHVVADEVERVHADATLTDPWLAYAAARRRLARDEQAPALELLARAQALLGARDDAALIARVAFTVGGLQITASEAAAADVTLTWAEGMLGGRADAAPDIAHLRALIAEQRGDRDRALAGYRTALRRRAHALTPLSAVLAMRNLGAALVDSDPLEARSLYSLALAQLQAHELDPAIRPALANALAYSLICLGDLPTAREALDRAGRDAVAQRRARIVLYTRFNGAIIDELEGAAPAASSALAALEDEARDTGLEDIAAWARLRRAWLDLRRGETAGIAATLLRVRGAAYTDAVGALRAILAFQRSRDAEARRSFSDTARRFGARGDRLGQFAMLLWLALAEERAGRTVAARRQAAAACALGSERGFVLSPNWWAPEIVDAARRLASRADLEYAAGLHRPPDATPRTRSSRVTISSDAIRVDGVVLPAERWRVGRSGSGVLRRLFGALVAAYPAGIHRDALADLLWPDSEGDKAVRNLYAATDDLRRLLAELPGVRLASQEGRYLLAFGDNVTLG
ncbi:MAG TPA: hypothetical protein VFW12_06535 [Candidatus Limnocylindria bacterium]|nr:hypothetical protein [Candidatus Limnocylindria bacterium]